MRKTHPVCGVSELRRRTQFPPLRSNLQVHKRLVHPQFRDCEFDREAIKDVSLTNSLDVHSYPRGRDLNIGDLTVISRASNERTIVSQAPR